MVLKIHISHAYRESMSLGPEFLKLPGLPSTWPKCFSRLHIHLLPENSTGHGIMFMPMTKGLTTSVREDAYQKPHTFMCDALL